MTTGAFYEIGPTYDRKMMNPADARLENVTMTAHVLIALSAVDSLTGVAQSRVDTARTGATAFLDARVQYLQDPFHTALVAYALTVAPQSAERQTVVDKLREKSIDGSYWSREPIPANPTAITNTVPYIFPRQLYPHEGAAVQATSYALLVYTINDLTEDAEPVMKWLQTMRNTIGGFAGTRVSAREG